MTHEQKPENVEFRTREEQVLDVSAWLTPYFPAFPSFDRNRIKVLVNEILSEAESRGAAEQRQKDEDRSNIIWQMRYHDGTWGDVSREVYQRVADLVPSNARCLYTRPANVAALEARITSLTEEMDARIAEAVAAERQRAAAICDALADEINASIRNGSSSHDNHSSPASTVSSTAVDLEEAIINTKEVK